MVGFIGCSKDDDTIPQCIEDLIEHFKNYQCEGLKVDQYKFQGKFVYVFDENSCGGDFQSYVYSSHCKKLGYLGGFVGNSTINGGDFNNAVFIKTVWKK